uniref:ubiquitinyl hydrolase 1 n=1 Tax=Propithecus coquereli TaxID=379532 RepID=A0A2K6GWS0_PROCO
MFFIFLNYLLNAIADILQGEKKQEKHNGKLNDGNMNEPAENNKVELTWVHEIFQGTFTNETRCLNCETVSSSKDEDFLDLSVYVDQNTSIYPLRDFSNTETLCSEQKYYCETCCSKQEGKKAAHDLSPTSKAVQVHGAAPQVHQAVLSGDLPSGTPALRHLQRCGEPGPHV